MCVQTAAEIRAVPLAVLKLGVAWEALWPVYQAVTNSTPGNTADALVAVATHYEHWSLTTSVARYRDAHAVLRACIDAARHRFRTTPLYTRKPRVFACLERATVFEPGDTHVALGPGLPPLRTRTHVAVYRAWWVLARPARALEAAARKAVEAATTGEAAHTDVARAWSETRLRRATRAVRDALVCVLDAHAPETASV